MATLKEHILTDLDNTFFNMDEYAMEVVYTPEKEVLGKTIPAIVDYGLPENNQGNKGEGTTWTLTCERDVRSDFGQGITRRIATVVIKTADVADPQIRDIITIAGYEFRVAEVFDHA